MKNVAILRRGSALVALGGFAAGMLTAPALAYQNWSDENIAYARGYVAQAIGMLSHDDRDYGGHRAAAAADLNGVESNLSAALAYDSSHERFADPRVIAPQGATTQTWLRGQGQSNWNIEQVDASLRSAATMLSQDQHDYGGFRVKAIAGVEAARAQLRDAIAYIRANPLDSASDRNMRYARWFVERGIDQLQQDQRDYQGNRVAAIEEMQQARQDILAGLRADAGDPRFAAIAPANVDPNASRMRNQNGSNENLESVRRMVGRGIAMLSRDSHDYDGYRVRAIDALGQARQHLTAALGGVGETDAR